MEFGVVGGEGGGAEEGDGDVGAGVEVRGGMVVAFEGAYR